MFLDVRTVFSLRGVTVELADGSTETIDTTDSHPFYVQNVGWVSAEDLTNGMTLSSPDGQTETVLGTTSIAEPQGVQVYTLEVDGDHTFFVEPTSDNAGLTDQTDLDAVWVHNDSADARALRANLNAQGYVANIGDQAAHIVPTGAFSRRAIKVQLAAQEARDLLGGVAIDLNESVNGFFTNSARHFGSHTDAYLLDIANRLRPFAGDEAGILQELGNIQSDLIAGMY